MLVDIDVHLAPNPLLLIFHSESALKMDKGIPPCRMGDLLFGDIALKSVMNMVEDCLLAMMEACQAHFLRTEGLDQLIELIE